jgi:(p)ppGpp synthase/HD superfamily hydrolase
VIRAVMMRELIGTTRPDADLGLIQRAYEVAAAWHQGQVCQNGDPCSTYPVAVAKILAGVGADDQMLCAALLHSAIRTTPCTLTELSRDFGADIETLVAVDVLTRKLGPAGRAAVALWGPSLASGVHVADFGECQQAWPGWPARPAEVMAC